MKLKLTFLIFILVNGVLQAQIDFKSGLVAYYPFNGNANDESENGNHGTVYGVNLTKDRFGNLDKAFSFDGIDDYIEVYSSENLSLQNQFSFSAMINPKEYKSLFSPIFQKSGKAIHAGGDFSLNIKRTEIQVVMSINNVAQSLTATNIVIELDNWCHIFSSWDGQMLKIYLNGKQIASKEIQGNLDLSNLSLLIGSNPNGEVEYFCGTLDDIRIYNRALNEQEIQALYRENGWSENFGDFTDSRDGKNYKTVKIGNQVWMAENLAYLSAVSPSSTGSNVEPYYYIYGYEGTDVTAAKVTDNYHVYGVLYNWPAAKAACPPGWHLPSDDEWEQLAQYVSNQKGPYSKHDDNWLNVGKHLKATIGWNSNGNGTDDFGFSGLPGGRRGEGVFAVVGYYGVWWSFSEESTNSAWNWHLGNQFPDFYRSNDNKWWGSSVRCVKDDPNTTTAQASILGIITNSETGLPIQGAIVKTLTYQSTPTDASGNYVLKVPYGYGYKLNVLSPTFETVTISDIHVPKSSPTKEVNIKLVTSAIDPGIVTISPNPNPFTSTVPQGGVLHRYYKIINKNSGNPLPLIPVDVAGNQYLKTFTTDENGIVDIAIRSDEVGDGNIGTDEVFNIISVNNISLETPWAFPAYVSAKIYSRYFDGQNYQKLGGNLLGIEAGLKRELGGITTLNVDESKSTQPKDIQINRQVRGTAELGFKVHSPGLKTQIGSVTMGAQAEAGFGIAATGIKEDGYIFPYLSENNYQSIAKYILVADGNYKLLDNTLIRLLTLCETMFTNDATLLDANSFDSWGIEIGPFAKASAFAGIDAGKNVKLGLLGDAGIQANAGIKGNFNHFENQFESSFSLSGKINAEVGAGIKLGFVSDVLFSDMKTKLRLYETELQRGLKFTTILDYNDLTKIKELRITFLSRNLFKKWEEEVEYRISGEQVTYAISNLLDETRQITNAPLSGMNINLNSNTFEIIIKKVFKLLNDIQTTQNGDASVFYKVEKTDLTQNFAINIGLEASITALAVNIGAGASLEEGKSMIVEEGKWAWGKHFINKEYIQPIPNVSVDYKTLMQNMIKEIPIGVRSLLGDFRWLKFWEKSSQEQYAISENGSYIELPDSTIPSGLDSLSVTSWSWYGNAPILKSASLSSLHQSVSSKNKAMAEEIYGMQYGIGGFYQFEPYGMELLDTCFLTIKYDPAELGNLNENSLGMYWEDKQNKKWVYIGGVVDIVNHSVTAPITHLSLFTLAPAMPYGEFGMHATPDSIYADSISVTTVVSDSIFNNDLSLVKEGTLFTIGLSMGKIVDSDTDPTTEGIQLPVQNGIISFKVKSHHLAGVAEVKAGSVEGSSTGSTKITFYDTIAPSIPLIISAINDSNAVLLNWKANHEEDIAGYIIYYDTDTLPPFDGVHTVYGEPSPIVIGNDTLRNISELLNDSIYYFAVSAYDASGNESPLSNFVNAKSGKTQQCYILRFNQGWNIFSAPNYPDSLEMKSITQPLISHSSLVKIQDESGNSLEDWGIFGGWQNNIGNISPTEGYKIKVSVKDSIEICGTSVKYPFAIPLKSGWNITGYPHQTAYSGMSLVQQLIDRGTLVKVQDEKGNSIEDWGIFGGWQNNIGDFVPGEGYKIKVTAADTLWIYESYPKSSSILPELVATTHFQPAFEGNGVDHMNFNLVGLPTNVLEPGDELAVFDGAICVGAVTLTSNHLKSQTVSIAASSTDKIEIAGFSEGNLFSLRMWNSKQNQELRLEPEIISGTSTFAKHETTVASLEKYAVTGLEGIPASDINEINCYPNPFSHEITVEINLYKEAQVEVEVFNQLGQKVKNLADRAQLNMGIHRIIWDGKNSGKVRITPGIYNIRLKIDDMIYYRKAIYSK